MLHTFVYIYYRVSLQAVSEFDDVRSTKVGLLIPRLQDESGNKEDLDESMVGLVGET